MRTKTEWLELCEAQMDAAKKIGRRDLWDLFFEIALNWGLYD